MSWKRWVWGTENPKRDILNPKYIGLTVGVVLIVVPLSGPQAVTERVKAAERTEERRGAVMTGEQVFFGLLLAIMVVGLPMMWWGSNRGAEEERKKHELERVNEYRAKKWASAANGA